MKTCPHCKAENADEVENCLGCAAQLRILENATLAEGQDVPKPKSELFPRRKKIFLWIAAWVCVFLTLLAINPAYTRAAFLFPIGLFAFFAMGTQNAFLAWSTGGFIIGWVLYALLSVIMFGTKNKKVFAVIYVIFCILLALNVGGCVKILEDTAHIQ